MALRAMPYSTSTSTSTTASGVLGPDHCIRIGKVPSLNTIYLDGHLYLLGRRCRYEVSLNPNVNELGRVTYVSMVKRRMCQTWRWEVWWGQVCEICSLGENMYSRLVFIVTPLLSRETLPHLEI